MSATEIVEVIGELVPDEGTTLERQHGSQALLVAQEMQTALVPYLKGDTMRAAIWQQFQAAPDSTAPLMVTAVDMLLKADAALAQRLDTLLAEYRQVSAPAGTRINTGGGAYVGGSVRVTQGDFVGRDKTVRITGDGNVVGDHSSATVSKRTGDPEAVARAFREFYAAVEARPDTSSGEKADLRADLEELEEEVSKGERADEGFLARRLRSIGRMAPDILEVVTATLADPRAGFAMVAQKVARKAKAA